VLALLLVLLSPALTRAQDRVVIFVGLPAGHPVFKDRNGAWLLLEAKEPKQEYFLLRLKEANAELKLNLSSGTVSGSLRLLWKEEPRDGKKLGFARKMSLQGTFSPAGYDPGGSSGREPLIKGTFEDEYHGTKGEWVGYLNDDRGVVAHERDFVNRGTTLNYQTTVRKRGTPWITIYAKGSGPNKMEMVYGRVYGDGGPAGDDDYPAWFVRTRNMQADLNDSYTNARTAIVSLVAAAKAQEFKRSQYRGYLSPLPNTAFSFCKPPPAVDPRLSDKLRERLEFHIRECGENIAKYRAEARLHIRLLDSGWRKLRTAMEERLERDPSRRSELEPWLNRVRADHTIFISDLTVLADQDEAALKRLIQDYEVHAREGTTEEQLLAHLQARMNFGYLGRPYALHAAQEFVKRFGTNEEGKTFLKAIEIDYLSFAMGKLRRESAEVDQLLREWGGGQINLQTGDWQWASPEHVPWLSWVAIKAGEHREAWRTGRAEQARAADAVYGLILLMHWRDRDVPLSELHAWLDPKTPAEVQQRLRDKLLAALPEGAVASVGTPAHAEHLARLEGAVRSALAIRGVERLCDPTHTPPLPEESGDEYLHLDALRRPGWDDADAVGQFIVDQVVVIGTGRFAGNVLAAVPRLGAYLTAMSEGRIGRFLLIDKQAGLLNRYRDALSQLPGIAAPVAKYSDPLIRAALVDKMIETAVGLVPESISAESVHSGLVAINLLRFTLSAIVHARAGQLQKPLAKFDKDLTALADERHNHLNQATTENLAHRRVMEQLQAHLDTSQANTALAQDVAAALAAVEKEIAAFPGAKLPGRCVTLDEKLRLREVLAAANELFQSGTLPKDLPGLGAKSLGKIRRGIAAIRELIPQQTQELATAAIQAQTLKFGKPEPELLKTVSTVIERAKTGKFNKRGGPEKERYHGDTKHQFKDSDVLEILSKPDCVYRSEGKQGKLYFWKDGNLVVLDGTGSARGNAITAYGPKGIKGDSGAQALGGQPTDPGGYISHDDIVNGRIPDGKGKFFPKAVPIDPRP
jgi:hypothetical protein